MGTARTRASNKWNAKSYDRVNLVLKKEASPTKEEVQAAADAVGESLNAYIVEAIRQRLESSVQSHATGNAAPSPHSAPEEIPGEMQNAMDVLKASAAAQIAGVPDEMHGPVIQPDDDTEARRAALLESIKRL